MDRVAAVEPREPGQLGKGAMPLGKDEGARMQGVETELGGMPGRATQESGDIRRGDSPPGMPKRGSGNPEAPK